MRICFVNTFELRIIDSPNTFTEGPKNSSISLSKSMGSSEVDAGGEQLRGARADHAVPAERAPAAPRLREDVPKAQGFIASSSYD